MRASFEVGVGTGLESGFLIILTLRAIIMKDSTLMTRKMGTEYTDGEMELYMRESL